MIFMGLVERLFGTKTDEKERYLCWMCDESYALPGDFLNHIKECKERKEKEESGSCIR